MPSGFQAVGEKPFLTDPGLIAPDVLRMLWMHLEAGLPLEDRAALQTAVSGVGMAGFAACLLSYPQARDLLLQAVRSSVQQCIRSPELIRRAGSDLCSAAFGIQPPASRPRKKGLLG